jgi:hypothetical protein
VEPHRLEVADVIRKHGGDYLKNNAVLAPQKRVLQDLAACRTAALGGHVKRCNKCDHEEFFYESCDNRHCPKCQGPARAKWLEQRAADLLETLYFHLVFTLPHKLGPVALQNKLVIYGILFRAVAETLRQLAGDPKHLGAEIGFLAVLHTWGQRLDYHPHIHCVVPGGGLSPDRSRWISSRDNFFIHVKVLSRVFRGKFLDQLRVAFEKGKLCLEGQLKPLRDPRSWDALLKSVRKGDWVVYAKRPFGGPRQVLKYLARYTHRVAISNQRLVSMADGKVSFSWKDYADGSRQKTMTLQAHEFIRRFLLHVLPIGFHKIRHYGFLANKVRKERLELCRRLLGQPARAAAPSPEEVRSEDAVQTNDERPESQLCPVCKEGLLVPARSLARDRAFASMLLSPGGIDSS